MSQNKIDQLRCPMCKEFLDVESSHVLVTGHHIGEKPDMYETYSLHTDCWREMSQCVEQEWI
jgi:uncharacterized protein YbaR (Trm112 family)